MKYPAVFGLCFFCSLAFSQDAWPQGFSSIDSDLRQLENLIYDTIANTEEQQRLLEGLRKSLDESGELIANYESRILEQENLLQELQTRLSAMLETYRTQSALSAKYERRSKFWRTFTLIAIPATALISGGIVYGAAR
jgi:chromosome segregation ATPase